MISKKDIDSLKTVIQQLYLSDSLPWVIGYSGGKDSTATLQLVWMALSELRPEELAKTVHVINTNTMVESPVILRWVDQSLDLMRKAVEEQHLPFEVHQLVPKLKDTFWVNFIGKGYPVPRRFMRWCTDRLKIQPVNDFIRQKLAEHGEIIMVLGTRKAESTNRARTMAALEKKRVRELLSPNPTLKNEYVFSPLEDWTDDDVWVFLMQYKNPWGQGNDLLLTLYKGATSDGECPIIQDKSTPSCGNSRFGCWVCTVVNKDKSMEAMISNDKEQNQWLEDLSDLRNEFADVKSDRQKRSFRKMHGQLQGFYGKLNHGPYLKSVREDTLRRLLELQKKVQEEAPEEYRDTELITKEELRMIRRIWVLEKHEFDDSLPRIYQEIFQKEFDDPDWIYEDSFGKEEWDLLQECCKEYAPDETLLFEMVSSILDLEKHAQRTGNRKGLMSSVTDVIQQTFYKDEEDGLGYYERIQTERKEKGLSYNKIFFGNPDSEKDTKQSSLNLDDLSEEEADYDC